MAIAPTDSFTWIGSSGGSWSAGSNWADTTSGRSPAGAQPGGSTPVVISVPTGSAYEVITGGGSAASIAQTGLIDLTGTYAVAGLLAVGNPAGTIAGLLSVDAGSAISAGAIAVNSGTVRLAGSLHSSGAMTLGVAGANGIVSVGAGGSLGIAGSLIVSSGSLFVDGTGAVVRAPSLTLGVASYSGDFGELSVGAGGTVAIAGPLTEPDGAITVSGSGAVLSVAGTLSLQSSAPAGYGYWLEATGGGSVRAAGLAFGSAGTSTATGSFYSDSTSMVEIGTLGSAAAGALTIDPGATISASVSTLLRAPRIIDNGTIIASAGTLTLGGSIAGTGTLLVGANALLRLNGTVAATDTIVMAGSNAVVEVGAFANYDSGSASYIYTPYPERAPISGFAPGDSLTFDQIVATAARYTATGANIGTLALFNGTTQVAAVTLVGAGYGDDTFFLSPTTSGAEAVSILPGNAGTNSPVATGTDSFTWIGSSGGSWSVGSNWADTTSGTSPAGAEPGGLTPVVIGGPTGSVYEVITSGGSAASIAQTGLVDLTGTYAVAGLLAVGNPGGTVSGLLLLDAGSVISAGTIAVNSGTVGLAGSLHSSGAMTLGVAGGYVMPSGTIYTYQAGANGLVNVGAGGSLGVGGSLMVSSGSLFVDGIGAMVTARSLALGTGSTTGPFGPGGYSAPHYHGSFGELSVSAGGTVAIAGPLTEPDGAITVSGSGAVLSVAGTLSLQSSAPAGYGYWLEATGGGSVRAAGLAFGSAGTSTATGSFYSDSSSMVEIGTLGGAAVGALTIDPGATISASVSTLLRAPLIIDNGTIIASAGTLTLGGSIAGTGILLVRANALLRLNGTVAATDTIVMAGSNAAVEVGAFATYDSSSAGYVYAPYPERAPISGFAPGDSLTFDQIVATAARYTATGANIGTLALFNGTTQVAAVTLVGAGYGDDTFFLSPTTSGAEAVSITHLGTLGPSDPRTLIWTGDADTNFANAANWNDSTLPQSAAASAPDSLDFAAFTNAGGVITGSGTAAALSFGGDGVWHLGLKAALTTGTLTVGSTASALLLINQASSLVTSGDAVIAVTTGADGSSVNVTGSGSSLQVAGALAVGNAGAGALSLSAGASVTADTLDAGVLADSSGIVTLSGTHTALTTTGTLSIGDGGIGELSVLNGATLSIGGDFNVGEVPGGAGNVDVEGTSTLIVGGNLNMGAGGPAEITVGPNATFMLENGVLNGTPGNATLTLFTIIDPLASNGITQNIKASGVQSYTAFVTNSPFNLAPGINYTLDTPVISGTATFTIGGPNTTLVLNADTVSSGTTIAFTDATGKLVLGHDELTSVSVANGKGGFTSVANPHLGDALIGGFSGVISGFTAGDQLVVQTDAAATFTQAGSVVSVIENGVTLGALTFATTAGAEAAAAGGLVDQVLCFLPDTLIATPDGEVKVQALQVGDLVRTASGADRPVAWIGQGRVLAPPGSRGGRRTAATPVIVRRHALAHNVPHYDLHVTKGHALFIDDVLIPVEFLVNHRSILWDDQAREVSLYHVELDTHDVLLANGAPAESYRDDGNRWLFQNANSGWGQPEKPPCAPVLTGGPVVDAVWQRLLERSGPRPGLPLTEDADVHLLVDGVRVDGARAGDRCVFRLRRVGRDVRLVSRAASPAELGLARDPRVLGVAVRRLELWQGPKVAVIEADDARLADGFHGFESDGGIRWTDGDAGLPVDGVSGAVELVVHLGGTTRYAVWDAAA